ncbi:MAG: DNA-binding response regulator [Planctomycetes bacterium]|nr:DNA-binding response regulator [Planctomycetota bacterium]
MSEGLRFPDPAPHVLVVDDERMIRWSLRAGLEEAGAAVEEAASLAEARRRLAESWPDLMLLDLRLPDGSGFDLLAEVLEQDPELPVLIITAYGSLEGAVQAMRDGAQDYIAKPFELDELIHKCAATLERQRLRRLTRFQTQRDAPAGVVAESDALQQVVQLLQRIGRSGASTVLLTGESGVGKGLAARVLHDAAGDPEAPFIPVACTAIPETLLESELFGHERGAFTDARESKPGLAELAHGGTLFLDEIGDLPAATQAKMLTLLEDRSFRRVGGTRQRRLEARVVAATNRDLEAEVAAGRFRADLFYRLRVVPVRIPALRERVADVRPLAEQFMHGFAREFSSPVRRLAPETIQALEAFDWPGNVRELRNAMERAVLLAGQEELLPSDLPPEVTGGVRDGAGATALEGVPSLPQEGCEMEALERAWVAEALRRCQGNRSRAARLLGLNRDQIRYRIEKFGLDEAGKASG